MGMNSAPKPKPMIATRTFLSFAMTDNLRKIETRFFDPPAQVTIGAVCEAVKGSFRPSRATSPLAV